MTDMRKDAKFGVVLSSLDIPAMPVVALKIINLLDDSHSAVWQLEQIITMDQSLTVQLLKIANSAYYSKGSEIDNVTNAILRMGYDTVRSIAVMASLSGLRNPSCDIDKQLWGHSLAVGVSATIIARRLGNQQPSDFLIPALLHDVGKVLLNRNARDTYANAIKLMNEKSIPAIEAERMFFEYDHAEVGTYAASKWRLPEKIVSSVAFHHCEDIGTLDLSSHAKESLMVTMLADSISGRLGYGLGISSEERTIDALAFLGISDPLWIDQTCSMIQTSLPGYFDFLSDN